jgi:hypothetical protein
MVVRGATGFRYSAFFIGRLRTASSLEHKAGESRDAAENYAVVKFRFYAKVTGR